MATQPCGHVRFVFEQRGECLGPGSYYFIFIIENVKINAARVGVNDSFYRVSNIVGSIESQHVSCSLSERIERLAVGIIVGFGIAIDDPE